MVTCMHDTGIVTFCPQNQAIMNLKIEDWRRNGDGSKNCCWGRRSGDHFRGFHIPCDGFLQRWRGKIGSNTISEKVNVLD